MVRAQLPWGRGRVKLVKVASALGSGSQTEQDGEILSAHLHSDATGLVAFGSTRMMARAEKT